VRKISRRILSFIFAEEKNETIIKGRGTTN